MNLTGPHTGLSAPAGVVYDGNRIWVANFGNDSLTAYTPGAGDVTPDVTIAGILTGLAHPKGLALDRDGNLLVANNFGASVTTYRQPGADLRRR